jgi:hypothetical protein
MDLKVFVQSPEDCTMHIYEPEDLSNVLMCHQITFKHDFSGQTIIFGGIYGTGKIFMRNSDISQYGIAIHLSVHNAIENIKVQLASERKATPMAKCPAI